jgi:hypothetical protein
MTGTQALVRLLLAQKERDARQGALPGSAVARQNDQPRQLDVPIRRQEAAHQKAERHDVEREADLVGAPPQPQDVRLEAVVPSEIRQDGHEPRDVMVGAREQLAPGGTLVPNTIS